MVELLNRHSSIKVKVATTKHRPEKGEILIVPPNRDVDIKNGEIILTPAGEETRPKPSVDRFFASLAREYGPKAVGIILSGSGSDGAEGLRAISSAGGICIAQDVESSKYDGMPRSAIATEKIDLISTPAEIAEGLIKILTQDAKKKTKALDQSTNDLERIFKLIYKKLGTDFSQYKVNTLRRRLVKRMSYLQIADMETYIETLKDDPKELKSLANEFLVSVTSFFRDPVAFDVVCTALKKIVDDKKDHEEVRVWSAGCATGEEAYSFAMVIHHQMMKLNKPLTIKVFATDLDHDAISQARLGMFSSEDIKSIPEAYRESYLIQRGDQYEISKDIRDVVVFAKQDLVHNPPFVKLDMVSCRNVLIYFENNLQKKILEIFHYALIPNGLLFLGRSESLGDVADLFGVSDKKEKLFYKKDGPSKVAHRLLKPMSSIYGHLPRPVKADPTSGLMGLAHEQILDRLGACGFIIEDTGRIQSVIGDVSPYFTIPAGLSEFSIQNLVGKSASTEIKVIIHKALKSKEVLTSRPYKAKLKNQKESVYTISVEPLKGRDDSSLPFANLLLVLITPARKDAQLATTIPEGDLSFKLAEAEQELAVTREHLQTIIEELGITNEELQSVNEELSSTNEELQSSNEELETTNEELQATNEELTTLNEELNIKSQELRISNSDLENIQQSIGLGLLVVDRELKLKRYNSLSQEIFEVSNSDLGRSIVLLSCKFEIDQFESIVAEVIRSGQASEVIVRGFKRIYQMRVSPAFDEDGSANGAIIIFINNTGLIQAENKWRKSEQRIRSIIDGAPSMIFLKDTLGKYLMFNRSFANFFNLNETEVIGKTDRDIMSEETANKFRNADLETIVKRKRIETEESVTIGGETYHFIVSRFPVYERDGSTPSAVGSVAINITKQITAQNALAQSEAIYRSVVEEQSVFTCRFRADLKIIFVNYAFTNFFGDTSERFLNMQISDLMEKNDQKAFQKLVHSLSHKNPGFQFEHKVMRRLSSERWIRWQCRGVFNDDGQVQEIQAVGFDITDYKLQNEKIIQRDALFSSIFNYTSDFISVFKVDENNEMTLESLNRTFDRGLSFEHNHYISKDISNFLNPQTRADVLGHYLTCVEDQEPQHFEEELIIQGVLRSLTTTLLPIIDSQGKVERIMAISRDITKFKQAEQSLIKAKEAAEVANQSKSDFLASMSHELRTPLNVVIGMSQLLENAQLTPDEKKLLESIERSGKVLLSIIDDVLDLSKIEAGKSKLEFYPFEVETILEDIMKIFDVQASAKKLNIKYNLKNVKKFYLGDAARISQILVNFVGNAMKFTEKGSITINVSGQKSKQTNYETLRFEVVDTGIGIPEESKSKIFKKFSQVQSGLSRSYGGSGLGLVICQRLVTLMKGKVGFDSEWNKGSVFWFEIPLIVFKNESMKIAKKNPEKTEKDSGSIIDVTSEKPRNILAIDDSIDNLRVAELMLKKMGHNVDMALSGKEALEKVKQSSYDLILMDVQMPEIDGYDCTRAVRSTHNLNSETPIVALTANAMVGDSDLCFEAGMNDYLTKPIDTNKLSKIINKWTSDT